MKKIIVFVMASLPVVVVAWTLYWFFTVFDSTLKDQGGLITDLEYNVAYHSALEVMDGDLVVHLYDYQRNPFLISDKSKSSMLLIRELTEKCLLLGVAIHYT